MKSVHTLGLFYTKFHPELNTKVEENSCPQIVDDLGVMIFLTMTSFAEHCISGQIAALKEN
jgi:hypothetical protein